MLLGVYVSIRGVRNMTVFTKCKTLRGWESEQ